MRTISDLTNVTRFALACFALAGCAGNRPENEAQGITAELASEIETICGLPAGTLRGQASISDDDMPKVACAQKEGQKRNVSLGFISNPTNLD